MKINQVIEGLKDPKDNPCWKGYKPVGTKKKAGKIVPNCVPKESVSESKKKPNATTRHLRDYPVSDKDVAKPVKKPEKKKSEQGVAEGSLETDNMVSHIGQVIQSIYPRGGDKNTYMKLVAREMPRIVRNDPKLFRRAFGMAYDRFFHIDQDDDFDYTDYSMRKGERGLEESSKRCPQCGSTNCTCAPGKCNCKPVEGWIPKQAKLNEEEYDYYRDYKSGLISYDEYQRLVKQFQNRDRDQRNRERDNDRGPWYLKVNGKILKSRGEVKVFDWKRGANNYALAILKNKPELNGKIYLTRKPEDDQPSVNESKTSVKVPVKQKPRQGPLRPQTGGGAHRDKKKEQKQGKEKHKKPVYEGFDPKLAMELEKLTKADDMFDAIYNALGRNDEVGSYLQDKMYDVARENRLHPDDDIESIIDIIADHLESNFGSSDLDETGILKVSKDDDNMTILQNPATGVQTQIDKKNPNAPRLTQDETGKLKLSVPQGAQTGQQGQEKKPNLIGKDVAVDSSPVEAVHRISASPSQPGGEITDVNPRSPISGDEDHDEISKLLNQRLRKLAGL